MYRERKVGAWADFGTVSFYPTKNLGAFGDAGLIVTNDPELAQQARLLRQHGAERQYYHSSVGGNFRLDALQAALLAVKLPHLDAYTAARRKHAEEYGRLLAGLEGRIVLPALQPGRTHIMNQYTIRVPGCRDRLRDFLGQRGFATAIYYPMPLHCQECFRPFGPYRPLPLAESLAAEVLSLPVFPALTPAEQEAVAEAIHEFFRMRQ
jgi:dTDP-4-amino-4,6-dideoxygalactose transaminase